MGVYLLCARHSCVNNLPRSVGDGEMAKWSEVEHAASLKQV